MEGRTEGQEPIAVVGEPRKFNDVIGWSRCTRVLLAISCYMGVFLTVCFGIFFNLLKVPFDLWALFLGLFVFGVLLILIPLIVICNAWRRYYARRDNSPQDGVPFDESLPTIVHPLPFRENTNRSNVYVPDPSFGAQPPVNPTAPSEVPMGQLGRPLDLPPSYSEVVGSQQNDIPGRVSPYHMAQKREAETYPSPAYNPSFPSSPHSLSPVRQTDGYYSPSHSPLLSPGRMSPGRTSPGRMSPGRSSPGRMSPGRTSPGRSSPGRSSPGRASERTSPYNSLSRSPYRT